LFAHIGFLFDQRDQSIFHLQENSCAILDLFVESTVAFDGESLACDRWIWSKVDGEDFGYVVFGVFDSSSVAVAWNWESCVLGCDIGRGRTVDRESGCK